MNLSEIRGEWIKKHDEMHREARSGGDLLAAPFLSIPWEANGVSTHRPVLLVGKATAGGWYLREYRKKRQDTLGETDSIDKRVQERLDATRRFLADCVDAGHCRSGFWPLWRRLHKTGQPVIWTNLAKIGVLKGNPTRAILASQIELARQTLKAEVETYKPQLILLVTGDFAGDELVRPVFGKNKETWIKEQDRKYPLWWTVGPSEVPVLWAYHPLYKSNEELDRWVGKAQELLGRFSQPAFCSVVSDSRTES